MGKKESNNQIADWRKKQKQRLKQKTTERRKEDFESKFKERDYDDVETEIERLRELKEAETISFEDDHKLARLEKYIALHAPELKKRQRERHELSEKEKVEEILDRRKRIGRYSIFYDSKLNPYGIAPPDEEQKYRWPDGTTKSEAPFQDEAVDVKRRRLEKQAFNVPGYTAGALTKISRQARAAAEDTNKDVNGTSKLNEADSEPTLMYIPPLPTEPYPGYSCAPLPNEAPPFDNVQDFYDVYLALRDLREEILRKKREEYEIDYQKFLERKAIRKAEKKGKVGPTGANEVPIGKGGESIGANTNVTVGNGDNKLKGPVSDNPDDSKKENLMESGESDVTQNQEKLNAPKDGSGTSNSKQSSSDLLFSIFTARQNQPQSSSAAAYAKATTQVTAGSVVANLNDIQTILHDSPMVPGYGPAAAADGESGANLKPDSGPNHVNWDDEDHDDDDDDDDYIIDPARQKELMNILDQI